MSFDSIDDLITEFGNGHMVVLVDDEDRENEGDLVMPAAHATPEAINFMARYGRGLICLPMTRERCDAIGLKLMVGDNREAQRTQFTVSIDAARGITTGISAADRATTILAAVRPDAAPADFVQPGHVFPLMSEPGGVLTRAGHTEAGCDLARLAGLAPAAVLVEILNEDGTMARRPDLERFAETHGLRLGTIADLIKYRMLNEKTVERAGECRLPTAFGEFRLVAFRARTDDRVHFALVAGEIDPDAPALVRVHVHDSLHDLTGSLRRDAGWPIGDALRRVAAEGSGVVVVLRPPEPANEIVARIDAYRREDEGEARPQHDPGTDLRTFGLGAQILADLGVRRMRVLSAPKRLHALSGFGLEVVEYVDEPDVAPSGDAGTRRGSGERDPGRHARRNPSMRTTNSWIAAVAVSLLLSLNGCGGGSSATVRPDDPPRPPPPEECPEGQIGTLPNCETPPPPPPEECPEGQVGIPPNCEVPPPPPPEECPEGQIGTLPNCETPPPPPPEECPEGQVGIPPNCEVPPPPPPEECPEGQIGTLPNCETPPPPLSQNEQHHRKAAGLSRIAPNGVWPINHRAIVKPKFAVLEVSTDQSHGRSVQAAACTGYAPGGCTVEQYGGGSLLGGDIAGVSNAPFTFIEPRPGEALLGAFTTPELGARLSEHPDLRIASLSISPPYAEDIAEFSQRGIATIWSAGNEATVNWQEAISRTFASWDGVLDGDKLLAQIANDELLLVSAYGDIEFQSHGRFVPTPGATQCEGVDEGCIYAPSTFQYIDDEGQHSVIGGTSVSAPFVAAGLASVLAVFPETSGKDLIRLAKACAVSEPGLTNGLGRFSLSCMDNSEVFYLNGTTDEESAESMSARVQGITTAFASAPLPGDSTYVAEVEGVSLTRNMEGSFVHRSGVTTIPQYQGEEDDTTMRVDFFYDHGNQSPGVRAGNREVFLAASWSNENSFFGYGQYQARSLNVSAGTEHLYLRLSEQKGDTTGYGVIDDVKGSSIGATLTRTFTTSLGEITPFLHMDKFTGGEATTPFGSMQIKGSEWNHELGFKAQQQVSEYGSLQVTATAQYRGDRDQEDYSVQAQYGLQF